MSFPVKAVIFDWAGTMVDFGCMAPVRALVDVFGGEGIALSAEEARRDMGKAKLDHVRALLQDVRIRARWAAERAVSPPKTTCCASSSAGAGDDGRGRGLRSLIPGAAETARELRALGVKIGSGTGYTRAMMQAILPRAAEQGYAPDTVVCSAKRRAVAPRR